MELVLFCVVICHSGNFRQSIFYFSNEFIFVVYFLDFFHLSTGFFFAPHQMHYCHNIILSNNIQWHRACCLKTVDAHLEVLWNIFGSTLNVSVSPNIFSMTTKLQMPLYRIGIRVYAEQIHVLGLLSWALP